MSQESPGTGRRSAVAGLALAAGAAALGAVLYSGRNRGRSLRGRTILVTGGSRGLGLELARRLVASGARMGLIARNEEELGRAADELGRRDAMPLPCDLRNYRQTKEAVERLTARFGGLDGLINVAGTVRVGPIEEMDAGDFHEQMESIFYSALHATLAALPFLRRSDTGRIVNIASIGGRIAVPHLVPYSAAKFALVGFSEGLRAELAPQGIKVTTVTPGLMRTGSPYRARFKGRQRDEFAWFLLADSVPLVSMSAGRAARAILEAMSRGDASLIVPAYVRLPVALHGLAPGLVARAAGLAGRLLPRAPEHAADESGDLREGRELIPPGEAPAYAMLTTRAARRNNQLD